MKLARSVRLSRWSKWNRCTFPQTWLPALVLFRASWIQCKVPCVELVELLGIMRMQRRRANLVFCRQPHRMCEYYLWILPWPSLLLRWETASQGNPWAIQGSGWVSSLEVLLMMPMIQWTGRDFFFCSDLKKHTHTDKLHGKMIGLEWVLVGLHIPLHWI